MAEIEARTRGAVELGLNVFAHNTVAVNTGPGLREQQPADRVGRKATPWW